MPSSVSFKQEQTYTNSHLLVEDTPAEDLLAAGGAIGPLIEAPQGSDRGSKGL